MARVRRHYAFLLAIACLVASGTIVGGTWLLNRRSAGEVIGSVPEGYVSELLWHGGYLYFAREALYSSSGPDELWKVNPNQRAVRVRLGGCPGGQIKDLAEGTGGRISIVRYCGSAYEVATLDPETNRLDRVALIESKVRPFPVINRAAWLGERLLVSGDGYKCSAVGMVEDSVLIPIPLLSVDGSALDLGGEYGRPQADCMDLPLGGFVSSLGRSVVLLASPKSGGMSADDRRNSDWFVYRANAQWKDVRKLPEVIRHPKQLIALSGCRLLLSADMPSPGIWLIPADGGEPSVVLEGSFSDFAADEETGSLVVLGPGGKSQDLRLTTSGDWRRADKTC